LVIANGWNWINKENVVDYRAVVEVKSPYLSPIYHKDYEKYSDTLKIELKRHLSAMKNDRVILTDALKWEFYNKSNGLVPVQTFRLYDLSRSKWEWKTEYILRDDITNEFKELKEFLKRFINKEV